MKQFVFILLACLLVSHSYAQEYSGYRAGNYTGVNGVFFNPANIADSRYRLDFNMFSFSTNVANDQASFTLKNTIHSFNLDTVKQQLYGANAGTFRGIATADIHGPSLMFNAGKKVAIAFTTRARAISTMADIDGKLINKIVEDFQNDPTLPYTISSGENERMNVHAWNEFGFSIAGVLSDQGAHFVKGGFTAKYLAGVASAYLNIDKLNTKINQDDVAMDAYLSNTTGQLTFGFGGESMSDFTLSKFKHLQSSGYGGDLGIVYEYRPNHEAYELEVDEYRRDLNKYKIKLGLSILDIGGIRYDRDMQRSGSYKLDIQGSERFYLKSLDTLDLDNYGRFFSSKPQYFMADSSYSESSYLVSLPTTIHLDLDYHFARGFYLNIASQLPLTNNKDKIFNSYYYPAVTLTPRFEGRGMGIYVPLNYNELSNFNAGVSFRLGPLFFGSGTVLTALFDKSKQADFHFGLRFGGLQKNEVKHPNKSKKSEKKMQTDYRSSQGRSL